MRMKKPADWRGFSFL
ncbi:hypothetical protein YPPY15_4868, partial [Yersinia pestis PY-15]